MILMLDFCYLLTWQEMKVFFESINNITDKPLLPLNMNHYQYCNKTQKIQTNLERSFVYDRFYIDPSHFYTQNLVWRDKSFGLVSVEHKFEAPDLIFIIKILYNHRHIRQMISQLDVLIIFRCIIAIEIQWQYKEEY